MPNENAVVSYSNINVGETKRRIGPSCGKRKQAILKRLLELRGSAGEDEDDGGDLVPGTPNRSSSRLGDDEAKEPVLGSRNHVDPNPTQDINETDMFWDNGYAPNYQGASLPAMCFIYLLLLWESL